MNRLLIPVLAAAALASCAPKPRPADEATRFNLDFEYHKPAAASPLRWNVYARGYEASVDVTQRHHGKASMKIEACDTTPGGSAFFNQILPVDAGGCEVCLTGWVRTGGVDDGLAGIWIGGDDNADWDPNDPESPSVKGTADWTKLTVRARLSDTAQLIVAGIVGGGGTAWFDDFRITIDGVPLVDSLAIPPKSVLTRSEKRALKPYVYPLRTWEPDGGSTKDLEAVGKLIGGASVVGLGEATHGSREIFRMKHRLIRYLAEREGFDIFSIEASMPESYAVGEYVAGGSGNADSLIGGMYFWTWNTESMRDLVEWMRAYNDPTPRIGFTGFDMQFYRVSLEILARAFAADEDLQRQIGTLQSTLDDVYAMRMQDFYAELPLERQLREAEGVFARLEERIAAMTDDQAARFEVPAGGSGRAWLRHQIALVRQFLFGNCGPSRERFLARDRFMADNLMWIREQSPASRIVAWAHNGHVMTSAGYMGGCLRERLGDDYRSVGFAFYEGGYTAVGNNGQWSHTADTAYPGTLEYLLGQLGEPVFLLDMRAMRQAHEPALEWLDALPYRSIGAMRVDNQFIESGISVDFDYLIFIRHTTPSRLLSKP